MIVQYIRHRYHHCGTKRSDDCSLLVREGELVQLAGTAPDRSIGQRNRRKLLLFRPPAHRLLASSLAADSMRISDWTPWQKGAKEGR